MKVLSIAVAAVSLVLIGLTLVPSAGDYRPIFALGALVAALSVLVTIGVGWRDPRPSDRQARTEGRAAASKPDGAGSAAVQPRLTTPAVPAVAGSGPADVVAFLAVLQDKGRLVDFLQDDIARYSDAQVGAAARVVHQGCKAVLNEYLAIVPVRAEAEGAQVTVARGYAADEYRFVGKISGQAPFSGILMHRGWKTGAVRLPRVVQTGDDRLPTIAPAEVELR